MTRAKEWETGDDGRVHRWEKGEPDGIPGDDVSGGLAWVALKSKRRWYCWWWDGAV